MMKTYDELYDDIKRAVNAGFEFGYLNEPYDVTDWEGYVNYGAFNAYRYVLDRLEEIREAEEHHTKLNSIFQLIDRFYEYPVIGIVFPNRAMAEVARIQYAIQEGVSEDSIEIVETVVARPTQLVMYDEIIAHGLLRD